VFHNDIRARFDRGDPEVREAMRFWAGLTVEARACLERGDGRRLGELMNANFDRRARLYRLSEGNLRLVAAARSTGASAKFTGSGGAIIGICEDDATFARLRQALEPLGVVVFRPEIV
jgi:glucuronokinase